MLTKYPDGRIECSAVINAIDFARLANEIFCDQMAFVRISVSHNPNNEDEFSKLRISAIPSATSDDVKTYRQIIGNELIEIDDDLD